MIDWPAICKIEPRLAELEQEAKSLGPDSTYRNYEAMKNRVNRLVGWEAEKEELRGADVWKLAHQNIAMRCAP